MGEKKKRALPALILAHEMTLGSVTNVSEPRFPRP